MSETTTDHATIRRWAERHGGRPAAVRATHGRAETGILRLEFPGAPQADNDDLEKISWEEFFDKFEKAELALVYQEDSNFNKLIRRDGA